MRFRIRREICVEVDSIEQLLALEDLAGDVVVDALEKWHIRDERGSIGRSYLDAMDEESKRALTAYGDEHWVQA